MADDQSSSRTELLAPAGDDEAMRAAVANGADAVYFGLSNFNARHRAANFTLEQLPEVMSYLHAHNVRGYVTLNTLIFSDELGEAAEFICAAAAAGVDALIVQDLGIARLIRRLVPDLPIHGSTQMTLTEPRGIEFVRRLGVQRVILARELSIGEVERIRAGTTMPVEVFVHGALCVAYSGQCLTSESLGGRSANRGQCAQACRLPYDLIVDGQPRDLGEKAYLLSPQDLAAYDLVDRLVGLKVSALKIEGRLKSAHYVAATTQTYRSAIDAALKNEKFVIASQQKQDLEQSFSRGFTHGFLDGADHQALVHARFPKSRGIRVGTVAGRTAGGIVVELDGPATPERVGARHASPWPASDKSARGSGRPHQQGTKGGASSAPTLKPGDGVCFDEGHPEQDEQGGRVFAMRPIAPPKSSIENRNSKIGNHVEVTFAHGDINLSAVAIGSIVWKTDDPAIRKRLQQSFSRETVAHRLRVDFRVRAMVGEKLTIGARDCDGHESTIAWELPLQRASKFPVTAELIREQFGRLGNTPFELGDVQLEGDGAMVPKSVLNDLRRQLIDDLVEQRRRASCVEVADPDALDHLRQEALAFGIAGFIGGSSARVPASLADKLPVAPGAAAEISPSHSTPARMTVLVRTIDQLAAVAGWEDAGGQRPAIVYCDFEEIRRYKDAVALARSANLPIALATLRVVKPSEEGLLQQIADCAPDAVLVRNLAAVSFYGQRAPHLPMLGDYSLNIANELTAGIFVEAGLVRMVPSYDLNWSQLSALLKRFSARYFETVVHQHTPMFHMEHCVFAHTLSTGKDYRDCGRPCDRHRVDLSDRVGQAHPLIPDVGCRNTLFNATAQSAAEYVPRMKELGVSHFRVELLRETAEESIALIDRYARVLSGQEDGRSALRQLRVLSQLGVTRGTLEFE